MLLFPAGCFHFLKKAASNACGYPYRHKLLVEGIPQAPMNAEFHSAAARPMDAFEHDQLTAGRGLFLFVRVLKSRKIEAECGPQNETAPCKLLAD